MHKLALGIFLSAQMLFAASASWKPATETELRSVIPTRAPVGKERIETEGRTASGITDGKGKFIAGAVLITAGYSADGKYSHFFVTQVPVKIGDFTLRPGDYVFGIKHEGDALTVKFYGAQTGDAMGTVTAERLSRIGRVESFHIYAPGDRNVIAIGRFGFRYEVRE